MMTFEKIRTLAHDLLGQVVHGNLADRVDAVIDRARVNADDTVYDEKAKPVTEWDAVALASVRDVLAYSDDAEVQAWFRANGVDF